MDSPSETAPVKIIEYPELRVVQVVEVEHRDGHRAHVLVTATLGDVDGRPCRAVLPGARLAAAERPEPRDELLPGGLFAAGDRILRVVVERDLQAALPYCFGVA